MHRVAALQGNHAHGHAHAPGTPLALEHGNGLSHAVAQHATGTMIGVHALAALLSLILLHRGERALAQALWALHCYLNTRLQSALRVPVLAPLPVFPRIYGRFCHIRLSSSADAGILPRGARTACSLGKPRVTPTIARATSLPTGWLA